MDQHQGKATAGMWKPRPRTTKLALYMKKRMGTPTAPLRRASSTPPSLLCRRNNQKAKRASISEGNVQRIMEEESREGDYESHDGEETGVTPGGGDAEKCSSSSCGREMLQRYRMQVAGNVWIPDAWDQEERLKEWVDPKVMDQALAPDGLLSARTALIQDCQTQREMTRSATPPSISRAPPSRVLSRLGFHIAS